MKKIFIAATALFAFGFAQAQENIRFGIKGGFNLYTLTGDDSDDAKSLAGFNLGAFAEFRITEKFSIQPEVQYSAQGAKAEGSFSAEGISVDAEGKFKLGYINVPVMAKFYVTNDVTIEAGPYVGFLTSAKLKVEGTYSDGGSTIEVSDTQDAKELFKSTDFGLNIGLGYNFTDNIFANARYAFGLSNIADDNDADLKNAGLQIAVGYRF